MENLKTMQKFVIKKISRSTNITLGASEDLSISQCVENNNNNNHNNKPQSRHKECNNNNNNKTNGSIDEEEQNLEITSIKMSGYLKKKRNVSG
jgi:hypothetical protein